MLLQTHRVFGGNSLGNGLSSFRGGYLKVRDDDDSLDLFGPLVLEGIANFDWWFRGLMASVDATSGSRKDFAQRNLLSSQLILAKIV